MAPSSKNKIVEEIRRDLFSPDDAVVMSAVMRCREEGNSAMVEPLIAFYATDPEPHIKMEVADMLGSLKVSNVSEYFIEALKNNDMKHVWKDLISFMWNSDLKPVKDLDLITKLAIRGEYLLTLECLTLLESLDTEIPEEMLLECITILKTANDKAAPDDIRKLYRAYMTVLEDLRIQNDLNE